MFIGFEMFQNFRFATDIVSWEYRQKKLVATFLLGSIHNLNRSSASCLVFMISFFPYFVQVLVLFSLAAWTEMQCNYEK